MTLGLTLPIFNIPLSSIIFPFIFPFIFWEFKTKIRMKMSRTDGEANNVNTCERDTPQCDDQYDDSWFFVDIVEQFVPYTIGALVWDQAERDVKCPVALAAYACTYSGEDVLCHASP